MFINENYIIKKENWNIEDTLKFIENCLIAFEKMYIKEKNKIVCYEEDFDTLDFNEVPYLLRNVFEVPEYIIEEISKFEILIKQLFFENEIKAEKLKNNIYFLLEFNNKLYSINYEDGQMSYSKMKRKINNNNIIKFEYLKKYFEYSENISSSCLKK